MSKLTKEILIGRGFKHVVENNDVFFYVSGIKKKYPDAVIEEADIHEKEVSNKKIKTVLLQDIKNVTL